jgi:acetyl esterase/lipase
MQAMSAASPLGPQVAHVDDGELPGAAGPVAYRLWRPEGVGPHPLIAYFHGGGWVLGSATSDESFCRDLCARTHSIVVSVDYRHAPESRFPAAADDALHAVGWLSEHAVELGAIPGHLAVAGWSAGANLAAVVCQRARDNGGPHITGQLLVCPVTDFDMSRRSYQENGEGFVLTRAVMSWFWDHYADVHERHDPRCAPLRGDLTNLPPAIVVTAQFDPLRDEGDAYAAALEAAGNAVTHIRARGHIHTSLTMVGVILSGADVRGDIASAMNAIYHVPAESTAAH